MRLDGITAWMTGPSHALPRLRCDDRRVGHGHLQSRMRRMSAMAMTSTAGTADASAAAPTRLARCARPALGLLLPVAARAGLGTRRSRLGWSNGRLVPPPSVIFATFVELARSRRIAAPHRWRRCRASPPASASASSPARLLGADHRLFGAGCGGCSIRPCRRCARFPRSPGCRCSSCGSAFSRPRRSR